MTTNILLCCTGSVATIKCIDIINLLKLQNNLIIKVVFTKCALHFCDIDAVWKTGIEIYRDEDEWSGWKQRGDPIVHIDLSKWADILLIAPLDANTLAKISQGLCDNLLTCIVRAWDMRKPLIFCPAMNTKMWEHPITNVQIEKLKQWKFIEVPCISKTLMCKDVGMGAMAEPETILKVLKECIRLRNVQ